MQKAPPGSPAGLSWAAGAALFQNPEQFLERNLVVQVARVATTTAAARAAAIIAGVAEVTTTAAALTATVVADLAAALAAAVEHLQLAAELLQHDLGRVAVLAL